MPSSAPTVVQVRARSVLRSRVYRRGDAFPEHVGVPHVWVIANIVPDGAARIASSGICTGTAGSAGATYRRSLVSNAPTVTTITTPTAAVAAIQRLVVRRSAWARTSTASGQFT
jgi:hypothetical protein